MVVTVLAVLFLAVCASRQQHNPNHYINTRANGHVRWKKTGLHFERDVELRSGQNPFSRKAYRKHRWCERSVPYVIDTHHFSHSQQNTIHQVMQTISSNNCIKFHPRSDETTYIRYQRGTCIRCHPAVGYLGVHIHLRVILGDGCSDVPTVMHETLRALVFWHEQSRPDRDVNIEGHIQKEGPCNE